MEKYLFTDGTNGVREVHSQEELKKLVEAAARPESIRIWVFNTHEWISYADFIKQSSFSKKQAAENTIVKTKQAVVPARRWLSKTLLFTVTGAAIFLVYNFTKIAWNKAAPFNTSAGRPSNVPLMDADSLIQDIETTRGQKLDKVTRTNLRLRNTWPDRILLQLNANRDTSNNGGSRFHDIELIIDNTTGYNLDNAVVKLTAWKNNEISATDTFRFGSISYAMAAKRKINDLFRADSLSVSFTSLKAKAFNFCYSTDKKSNYGNNTDKWFCREQ
jgi:hypothetical protein